MELVEFYTKRWMQQPWNQSHVHNFEAQGTTHRRSSPRACDPCMHGHPKPLQSPPIQIPPPPISESWQALIGGELIRKSLVQTLRGQEQFLIWTRFMPCLPYCLWHLWKFIGNKHVSLPLFSMNMKIIWVWIGNCNFFWALFCIQFQLLWSCSIL